MAIEGTLPSVRKPGENPTLRVEAHGTLLTWQWEAFEKSETHDLTAKVRNRASMIGQFDEPECDIFLDVLAREVFRESFALPGFRRLDEENVSCVRFELLEIPMEQQCAVLDCFDATTYSGVGDAADASIYH